MPYTRWNRAAILSLSSASPVVSKAFLIFTGFLKNTTA